MSIRKRSNQDEEMVNQNKKERLNKGREQTKDKIWV